MNTQYPDRCINAAAFEQFLHWLDPDPENAGRKYETLRCRLIRMFRGRQCVFAEDLADATFDRVTRKVPYITTEYTGDPTRYFYGVAKKVYLEYQHEVITKHRRIGCSVPTRHEDQDLENSLKQLDDALSAIPVSDREMILTYYTDNGRNRINNRRALAKQFGIGSGTLRLRAYRIRMVIKNYMLADR